jgi:hypothetical protein
MKPRPTIPTHSFISAPSSSSEPFQTESIFRHYRVVDEADIEKALKATQESIRQTPARNVTSLGKGRKKNAAMNARPAQIPHANCAKTRRPIVPTLPLPRTTLPPPGAAASLAPASLSIPSSTIA